jgi:PAS domain S-box-containing protein
MPGSAPTQHPWTLALLLGAACPVAAGLAVLALGGGATAGVVAAAVAAVAVTLWLVWAGRTVETATEGALQDAARHAEVVERAYEAFVGMDADGNITGWNARAEAIFGWPRDEAIGKELADLIVPPQHRGAHRTGLSTFLATGVGPVLNKRIEITAWHRVGREFPVELAIWAIETPDGPAFNAFIQDISERRQSESDSEDLASNLRMLLETSGEGIFEVDLHGRWTYVNVAASRWLGLDRTQVIGHEACRVIHHDGIDGTCDHQTCVIRYVLHTGERARYDGGWFYRGDGSTVLADCRTHPTVVGGKVKGAVVIFVPRTPVPQESQRLTGGTVVR